MAEVPAGQTSPPATTFSPPTFAARFALTAERRKLLRADLLVFLVTVLVYWGLGPKTTAYDYQLSQANNILHGHLDMSDEYTRNLGVLERVLYDPAVGFCLPLNDPRAPGSIEDNPGVPMTAGCKNYMQHSLGPALLLLPFAFVFGLDVNQTLLSALVGGLTALLAFAIIRHFTADRKAQIALTALAIFGTNYWFAAADGGVWYFALTTSVFFLFAAIYATVVRRNPLLAGAMVGAAFMCRPTTILAGVFTLVAFADQWYVNDPKLPLWRRLNILPLVKLAVGVAPFIALAGLLNYLRFNNPVESGYTYSEEFHQLSLAAYWRFGIADPRYIPDHVLVFFERMPHFSASGPYAWPSWWGLATWITTPPILYAAFVHLKRLRPVVVFGVTGLALACGYMLLRAIQQGLGHDEWGDDIIATGIHLVPFWILIAGAIVAALYARDRLVVAAWAGIVAIALLDFTFAATGWAQFGYRYALDFMPFLILLVVLAVGKQVRWHHGVMIGLAILVNLWGVLWIFQFTPLKLFGWTWVGY